MKKAVFPLVLTLLTVVMSPAVPFYAEGPREEINLAGKDWQEGIADTLDVTKMPSALAWTL